MEAKQYATKKAIIQWITEEINEGSTKKKKKKNLETNEKMTIQNLWDGRWDELGDWD